MTAAICFPEVTNLAGSRGDLDGWAREVSAQLVPELLDGDIGRLRKVRKDLVTRWLKAESEGESDTLQGALLAFTTLVDAWTHHSSMPEQFASLQVSSGSVTERLLRAAAHSDSLPQQDLAAEAGTSPEVVSRRGSVLEAAGLVLRRRVGKERHWSITPRGRRALAGVEVRPDPSAAPPDLQEDTDIGSSLDREEHVPTTVVDLVAVLRKRKTSVSLLRHFGIDPESHTDVPPEAYRRLTSVYAGDSAWAESGPPAASGFKRLSNARHDTASIVFPWLAYCGRAFIDACDDLPPMSPPKASEIRSQIGGARLSPHERIARLFEVLWSHGLLVLPTRFQSGVDGAFIPHDGRGVVVVNHRARQHLKWLNTTLHEVGHAYEQPDTTVTEDTSGAWEIVPDIEEAANRFAVTALLGEDQDIASRVLSDVGRGADRAGTIRRVARNFDVPKEAVAWHVAMTVSSQSAQDAGPWFALAVKLDWTEPDPLELWHGELQHRLRGRRFDARDRSLCEWWLTPFKGDPLD